MAKKPKPNPPAEKKKRKRTPPPGLPVGNPNPPGPVTADTPLSVHEQRFVEEYLIDRNAAAAYRRTFPEASYRSALQLGYVMRHRPNVAAEIQGGLSAQRVRSQVRADKVLNEVSRIAFSDILELFDPQTHQLRHPRHIPYDVRKTIASIKVSRERRTVTRSGATRTTVTDSFVEYKFWNKLDALQKLMSHLGLDATAISPLDALLAALPRALSQQVREALSQDQTQLVPQPSTNGHGTGTH